MTGGRDANQLAADVREAVGRLNVYCPNRNVGVEQTAKAIAALDTLVARITDLRDRDTWKERAHELEALEAQTARQRDGYAERAVAAEAEVERLTEALRGIASQEPDQDDVQDADPEFVLTHPRVFSGAQVARAVLAGRKDTQPPR